MAEQRKTLLKIKNLKKHYSSSNGLFSRQTAVVKAVDGIDLTVFEGETLAIVGESGCGKSTLGLMVSRLLEPTAGEIYFNDQNLLALEGEELRKARRELQIVFQDPFSSLNPRMKVFDIVAEPLQVHGLFRKAELAREVHRLLETVGLSVSHADRYPHEFSGGQRQRIGIARALALNPKLIICDEPISALDVSIQAQILNLLKDLQEQFQLTYLFISHSLPSVHYISDRIAVMYLGRIVEIASKDALFAKTKHPYTETLLESVPIPDPNFRKVNRKVLEGELPNPANPPKGCAFHTRCPYATSKCQIEKPELQQDQPDHWVACHYPLSKREG